MISETMFASNFSSVWRALAPTSELFVRKINSRLYSREFPEMQSTTAPNRRALINEGAFNVFVERASKSVARILPPIPKELINACLLAARSSIARIDKKDLSEVVDYDLSEIKEVIEQSGRLVAFFERIGGGELLQCHPRFLGCGVVDACYGDVLVGKALYEIKAGARKFRSVDIRQLLIYAALSFETKADSIQRLGLFNPRTGISVEVGLEEFCLEVSGKGAFDLLADIVQSISSGEMSR